MTPVYEAKNSAEAHLIFNLLEQAGITGRIDGGFLQGGIGEIQTAGLVRVMVNEADYEQGRELIKHWENTDLDEISFEQIPEINQRETNSNVTSTLSASNDNLLNLLVVAFIGVMIGIVGTYVYFRSPVTENGIDFDGDGIPDEWYFYKGVRFSESHSDRNLDKTVDLKFYYDHIGLLETMQADDNFDGVFESETKYKNNNPVWTKIDTAGDGFKNQHINYTYGVLDSIVFYNAKTQKKVKIDYFEDIKLQYSEIDTDSDGILDSRIDYDEYQNVIKTSQLKRP